jgi:hypothetical protein
MIKKVKYITAALLLLILPVSVIGLNFSTYKCNMSHETKVSLLFNRYNDNRNNYCDNANCDEDIQSCTVNSCKNNSAEEPNFTSPVCCINTFETFVLEDNYVVINALKIIPDFSQFIINFNDNFKFELNKNDNVVLKNLNYPLKELISNIIRFIHNNTNTGNVPDFFNS